MVYYKTGVKEGTNEIYHGKTNTIHMETNKTDQPAHSHILTIISALISSPEQGLGRASDHLLSIVPLCVCPYL